MAVNLIAQIEARPDTVDDVKVLMDEYAAHVLSMEGSDRFEVYRDKDIPTRIVIIEQYRDDAAFAAMARPFAGDLPDCLEAHWDALAALLRTRIERLGQIPDEIRFLIEAPAFDAELYVNKRNKVTPEKAAELLPGMMALLEAVPESDWNNDALYEKLNAYIEEQGIKKGLAMWVLRIAAAGQKVTPGGATEILSLLGKKISLDRLKKSLAKLQEV